MREVRVSDLSGGEYLAQPAKLSDNQILFYEGTCLYMKHIEMLIDSGIDTVSIFEQSSLSPKEKQVICENIKTDCTKKVKDVLESYVTYDDGCEEIKEAAKEIIDDVFTRPEIVDHVYDVRQRSGDLYEHCVNVASLSILTALKMNLSKAEVYDIGVGSLMHDMGLRYLSINYKNIDEELLTAEELFEYKKHTLYGFSSVEKENWISNEAKKIILYHHERLNGSGYPFKQVVMPLSVRIVAIVDAFDDMLCGIGCKKSNVRQALEHIRSGRDVLFEGRIVDYFLDFIAAYPVGTTVITSVGDEAVVMEQNEHITDRPKIRLIKDRYNQPYKDEVIIDLSEQDTMYIDFVKEES